MGHRPLCVLIAILLASPADAQLETASLRKFLQRLSVLEVDPFVHFTSALVDLNGDGRSEAVAQVLGPAYCGTGGCGLLILARDRNSWRVITRLSIAHAPIRVLDTHSRGWRDLGVIVAGGGVTPGYEVRLRFDGGTYPDNPSTAPAERLTRFVPGRVLIARDDPGLPLF